MATSAELLLISAILNEGDHVTAAAHGITADKFHTYDEHFAWIEKYIKQHRRAPSRAAFRAKFPGITLIRQSNDVKHFCLEVSESHAQAVLLESVNDAIGMIRTGDLTSAIKLMQESASETQVSLEGTNGNEDIITDWEVDYDEAALRVQRTADFGQAGIPTGFPTLDERTGGPQPGQFWVIAARLGEGKTWTLNRMATAALFGGYNVQYNALEMTRAEIAFRVHTFASSEYGKEVFKNLDLSQGRNFDIREYKEFLRGLGSQVKNFFRVADQTRGAITLSTMASQCERYRPDVSYLDYITLVENDNSDMRVGVTKLSAGIKNMAVRYQIPFVVAAQLNRNAAGRKEMSGPEDLAESDSIGRDADVVVTMRQMSKRVVAMKLAKNRHGKSGFIWYAKFDVNSGNYVEISKDAAFDLMSEDKDEDDDDLVPKQRGALASSNGGGFVPTMKKESDDAAPKKKISIKRSTDQDS